MRAERLSSVFPISGAALWQAASVVSCAASASNMKIDSSITLLPPHSPHTHKHTNLDPSLHWHSCCVSGYQYRPFFLLTSHILSSLPALLFLLPLPLARSVSPSFVSQSHVAAGSGEPGGDEYHSLVLYHNNSPRWAEQIKLPIPVDMFRGSHVRFEFRHCSSKWERRQGWFFIDPEEAFSGARCEPLEVLLSFQWMIQHWSRWK